MMRQGARWRMAATLRVSPQRRLSGSIRARSAFRPSAHLLMPSAPHVELSSELRERVKIAPLAPSYDPAVVEVGWQAYWQQALRSPAASRHKGAFSMILPPPNVTGALHIGHALTITIQDAIARWHRMRGFDVRWLPGLDHAGIATQSVVERKLQKERGLSRYDLGRDAFVDEVWRWNEQYGGRIMNQIDHLGAIITKDQSYFTLDEPRSAAVTNAFIKLHERGLIYRRRRMVNWCPTLQTAISDIEVDSEQLEGATKKMLPGRSKPVEFGVMHRFRYRLADSEEFLEVDTTRPETIFGDVAVAVHPEDPRYKPFHGKHVLHPFTHEPIPIVTDDVLVNMELGTGTVAGPVLTMDVMCGSVGVVKVTPAHDPKDFECGRRHGLPEIEVIDKYGKLCGNIDERFLGMDRFDARERVVEELKEMELYLDHPTALSTCSRSGDVIEPLLMPQWYVDCAVMARRAADNVRNGVMAIEPKSHAHTWFFFLDNIQDWCVSRQLWWGHRIPAYCLKPGTAGADGASDQWFVAASLDEARQKAETALGCKLQDDDLEQDVDVLDTWFSSGLLPLSTFGWPNANNDEVVAQDLNANYPLNVMETGSDILFFWVARMAMLCEEVGKRQPCLRFNGLCFSGRIPFEKVLLHPMVRDKAGRKMSKSLGNVIDPLHVIDGISLDQLLTDLQSGNVGPRELKKAEKELKKEFPKGIPTCGADALRFTLASYLQQGRQINMDVQRVVSYRHFCNKVWNAVRYALPLLEAADNGTSAQAESKSTDLSILRDDMALADRWIMSRLQSVLITVLCLVCQAAVVTEVNNGIAANQLASSVAAIQRFFVQELCDVYIEFSKPVLYGNRLGSEDADVSEQQQRARKRAAQATLHRCLDYSMRLLHPFTPFVTEELWQRIHEADPLKVSSNTPAKDDVMLAVPDDAETTRRVELEIARLEKRAAKSATAAEALVRRQQGPQYTAKVPEAVQAQDAQRLVQLQTDLHAAEKSLAALRELQGLI
ncbi:hypothetical protein BBJ28_00013783 [Nothophytophthora sp. Chile5]|nr:hypothetical protein BBJ28_00013783 [Nothophytophthora sp. Chile5]